MACFFLLFVFLCPSLSADMCRCGLSLGCCGCLGRLSASTVPVARLVPGLCAGCINMKRCCIIDETGESRYRDSRAGDTWTGSQTERQTGR